MNQVQRPDIPEFNDTGREGESHHDEVTELWNSREWGDVTMRIQVTAGR